MFIKNLLMNGDPGASTGGAPVVPSNVVAPVNVTPASTTNTTTPSSNDWTTHLNEELRGYVQNKGFKDPSAVVDSYRNLEKLRGVPQERLLTLPEKDDAPEWNGIYERLGKPKSADEYAFELPEAAKDPGFEKWAKDTFHANGISKKAAENIMKQYGEYFNNQMTSTIEGDKAKLASEVSSLKKEWGAAYEQNSRIADRAAEVFGMNEPTLLALKESMGPAAAMKFLHTIGSKLGEGNFVTGDNKGGGFGVLTPSAARDRITALKADSDFSSRYLKGDLGARQEMEKLHSYAYPSEI